MATLRFRRATATIDKYIKRHDGYDLSRMTNDEAHAIMKDLVELEFPTFMGLSIVFALFKTYGIPSISRVLLTTRQLVESDTASKRTADTGVLMLEFALNPPTSERAIKAIARMNYLHSAYLKAGKISNDDMLFTLSLFALEPVRWIERYEWRGLGVLEKCALGTYWKAMGDAMAISFQGLPSCKAGWTDGRHWLREVEEWSERYARVNMMPDGSNHKLADSHLDLLFLNVPKCMKIAGKQLVGVLVGERLRKAMM